MLFPTLEVKFNLHFNSYFCYFLYFYFCFVGFINVHFFFWIYGLVISKNFKIAEMKRAAIHDVCLHAMMYAPSNMPVKHFLSLAPEPPSSVAVDWSFEFLEVSAVIPFVH